MIFLGSNIGFLCKFWFICLIKFNFYFNCFSCYIFKNFVNIGIKININDVGFRRMEMVEEDLGVYFGVVGLMLEGVELNGW